MICPQCDDVIKGMNIAMTNLETYNPEGSCLVVTQCCNKPVILSARIIYSVKPYLGKRDEDDWEIKLR